MDWEQLLRGARYHEAGHAVAAHRHGYEVTGVTATDEDWITNYRGPGGGTPANAWRSACITMAGQLADQRANWGEMRPEPWTEFLGIAEFVREETEGWGDEEARDDRLDILESLEEMAAYAPDQALEDCYREVVEDTGRLLSGHWAEVEAVARALEETGTLDGPAVVRAIEGAGA